MLKSIKVILVILLLLLTAWLTPKLINNPGLIQIELLGYQIQITVIAATLLLLALWLAVWLLYGLLKAPKKVVHNITANSSRKKFARGLLALSEGKWPLAEKLLLQSAAKSPTPELSYMAAARAAVSQNRTEQAEEYLDQAEKVIDNPLTVDLTRCEIWIKSGDADRAMPLLNTILSTYPKNPRAIHLLIQASQQTKNWKQLQTAIPKAEKLAMITHSQSNQLKQQVTNELFLAAESEDELQAIWHRLNKKQQEKYKYTYCESGLRLGAFQAITQYIEKSQKSHFDEQLVVFWSALPYNLNHRLKVAEKWLQQQPKNPVVLLCNAKLHVAKQNWGQAESLLLAVEKIAPSKEVSQMLGLIYQEQQQPEKALLHFKQAAVGNEKAIALVNTEVIDGE